MNKGSTGFKNQIVDKDAQPDSGETLDYSKSRQGAFANLRYDLTDEELDSKGVQKLLLNKIVELENSEILLKGFREKYYAIDKECAVLKEGRQSMKALEVLYAVALSMGALLIGLVTSTNISGWFLGIPGSLLIIVAVIARIIRK
ncbi:MAG: hypothetical protein V3W14_10865 [Candidatus Neomarinimicrobiota bacterium]